MVLYRIYRTLNLFFTLARFVFLTIPEANSTFLFSRNPNDVRFYLYSNSTNTDIANEIPYGNKQAFANCGYNTSKSLIILIHGALSSYETRTDVRLIKDAYIQSDFKANIIMVDYGKLTKSRVTIPRVLSPISFLTFLTTPLNSNVVGKRISDFILFAINSKVLRGPKDVHLIGFSLGTHIAGIAGRNVKLATSKPIRRITGLDPSPQIPLRTIRLDETDAEFVDISYSSLGVLSLAGRIGHAQFFMNGGGRQPGCPNLLLLAEPYCSHVTAVHYFASSIKNKEIQACKCRRCRNVRSQPKVCNSNDLTIYGQYIPENTRGDFFVRLS